MTISTTWRQDRGQTAVDVQLDTIRWAADTTAEFGGAGKAPTPHDLLDSALGACTALTLEVYAQRHGFPLTGLRVDVSRQESGGVYRLDRRIALEGDLTPEQRTTLLRVAEHCPIHKALHGVFQVNTALQDA